MTDLVIDGPGGRRYAWEEWDPGRFGGAADWSHPGLAIDASGHLVGFDSADQSIVILDGGGELVERIPVQVGCGHGLAEDAGREGFWIVDNGQADTLVGGRVISEVHPGAVVRVSRDGRHLDRIETPSTSDYAALPFQPTSVAVDAERDELWVADGYGASLVHRYSGNGVLLATIDGTASGLRFDCPHAVAIDRRGAVPRILVADRGNARIVAFDLGGGFLDSFGMGHLTSPSAFAVVGDQLIVAELHGRLTMFDGRDALIGHLALGEEVFGEEGWPNIESDGVTRRRRLEPGRLVSPHGLAAGSDGTLFVAEWLIGGRLVRLRRTA